MVRGLFAFQSPSNRPEALTLDALQKDLRGSCSPTYLTLVFKFPGWNLIVVLPPATQHEKRDLAMLCHTCWAMLRGHEGRVWKGTFDLHFSHHKTLKNLQDSAILGLGCSICRRLNEEWKKGDKTTEAGDDGTNIDLETEPFSSTASLSLVRNTKKEDELFRLDFVLKSGRKMRKKTFVLVQTGQSMLSSTPRVNDQDSDQNKQTK